MKKSIIILVVSVIVLLSVFLWLKNITYEGNLTEIVMILVVIILIGFAFMVGISKLRSAIQKVPSEDELSKKLLVKSSSLSFYISIYFWLVLMYLSDKVALENHTLIGIGIAGMSVIFFLSWLGVRIFGLKYV